MTEEQQKLCGMLREEAGYMMKAGTIEADGVKLPLSFYAHNMEEAAKVIEEQDITIRAMMGEFGDSCDVDGCG